MSIINVGIQLKTISRFTRGQAQWECIYAIGGNQPQQYNCGITNRDTIDGNEGNWWHIYPIFRYLETYLPTFEGGWSKIFLVIEYLV